MDYDAWYSMDFSSWFTDVDAVLDAFDSSCHQAGHRCAFGASSQEAVKARRIALFQGPKASPVLIKPDPGPKSPDWPLLVTYSSITDMTLSYIQSPYHLFPELAQMYAQLENNALLQDVPRRGRREANG
jgi:hypothetical protein